MPKTEKLRQHVDLIRDLSGKRSYDRDEEERENHADAASPLREGNSRRRLRPMAALVKSRILKAPCWTCRAI